MQQDLEKKEGNEQSRYSTNGLDASQTLTIGS
jgi:hypothetical protein